MSDDQSNKKHNSSDNTEKNIIPVWDLLFDDKEEKGSNMTKENHKILESLLNKKVKVWSVLANTVNGVRGTWKGQVGVLTSYDDEFIVLDDSFCLSRKFIYRIENA